MKFCFSTLGCHDMGHEEIIALAKAHGMQGVELRGRSAEEHISPDTPPERRRAVKAMYDEAGVAIAGITGYARFCYTDPEKLRESRADVARYVQLCREMGADYTRFYIGPLEEGTTFEQLLPSIAENFDRMAEEHRDSGVLLLVEMHDSLLTGEQVAAIFARMKTDYGNVAAIWDTASPVYGGEQPQETYEKIRKHLGAVHLRDIATQPDGSHKQVMAGTGEMPLREQVRLLEENGYDGWYCIKWERVFDLSLAPTAEALDSFRDYAQQAAE